jgi:endonuclease/exonuclease/phosphatase family metal-dependent hydrolase
MDYYQLRYDFSDSAERSRVIGNLQRLRAALDQQIPPKDQTDSLLLATWNVRDLGKDYLLGLDPAYDKRRMRRGAGPRQPESFWYIAEIISRFDFVAVQEVNEIDEWEKIFSILGRDWDYIATEVTDPKLGGNGERLLFAYDKRKVFFRKIAGEIVLPPDMMVTDATKTGKQFARTPFLTSFQAGWFKFDICTVHIFYGKERGPALAQRVSEIDRIAAFLAKYARQAFRHAQSLFLLGDFNIISPDHETMQALKAHGFGSPGSDYFRTNVTHTMFYDQIAYLSRGSGIDVAGQTDLPDSDYGTFAFFDHVYRDGDAAEYAAQMAQSNKAKYSDWRTYQLSDHQPLWVRLKVNDSGAYLEKLKG